MAEEYTLTLVNDSAESGSLCCYLDLRPSHDFAMPVTWFAFPTVGHTRVSFSWREDYQFVWSELGTLEPGVVFRANQQLAATIGESNEVDFTRASNGAFTFMNQRAAEARYQQQTAEYVRTVLEAFSEVEGALLTRKMQLERRARVSNFVTEARATQQVAQSRYLRGLVNYLDVLDAQQTRFQAEENLVLVHLAILSNRFTLHRALGGGWAEPDPVAAREDGLFFKY